MTDQTNKLEPCPFCGGAAAVENGPAHIWYVECRDCGVDGKIGNNESEAIAAWNRRASAPEAGQEAYEQECLNMAAEGIKYWKNKYEALAATSAPAAGSVPSDIELMFVWSQTPNTGDMRIDLVAYARALLAQYGSTAWQPIETATMPKIGDTGYGERILLVVDCGPDTLPSVRIGWWSGHEWASDTGFTSLPSLGYRVTHWMPLPPAPQVGK